MTAYLWTVAAYTLQLAALVSVALVATRIFRLRVARHALRFWQFVIAVALILPLAQPRSEAPASFRLISQSVSAVTASATGRAIIPAGIDAATIVMLSLAAGVLARLLWLAIGLRRLRSIVTSADTDSSLAGISSELTQSLGVTADVRISDDLDGPATVGVRRPLILIPRSVLQMSAAVQRAIICHELVHVKRRDWLQTIAGELWCALLWFHPLAHVVAARLSLGREMVVDEMTILITRDRRAYAEALLAFSDPQPHVIGVTPFIGRHTLSQRISLIAEGGSMPRRRTMSGLVVAFTASIAITAAAVDRFPMFPTLEAHSPIYQAGPDITMPVVVHEVKPAYTQAALQKKIQGSVWVAAVIDQSGDVIDVRLTRSLDAEFGLDQEAIDATRLWKFKAAVKDGKPVHFQVTIEMTFTLK